jgi:tape measure domain-containing protein
VTTETFIIEVRERGAAQAAANINAISKSADRGAASVNRMAQTMAFFRKALVAFASIRAASHIVEFADSAILINNRLRVATKSAEDFARAQKFIFEVSRETRTEVQASAVVYSRLLQSTSQLTFNTEELEQVMVNLNKSIAIGGATSQEAKNALIQFSQALASGALRGDELRSVSEQLPALANAIGKEFGLAKGQLLAFAKANPGILEVEKVLKGVLNATEDLDQQFARTTPTIMNGFVAISNAVKSLLIEVQDGTGVFSGLSKALMFVGENLKAVIAVMLAFIAVKLYTSVALMTASFVAANNILLRFIVTGRIATAVQYAFNLAVSANPYVAAGLALAAFIAILVTLYQTVPAVSALFDGLWAAVTSVVTAIQTSLAPAWEAIKLAFATVGPVLMAVGEALYSLIEGWVMIIGTFNNVIMAWTPLGIIFDNLGPLLTGLGYVITGLLVGAFSLLVIAMRGVTEVLYAFGAVSDETILKVRASSDAWLGYANTLVTSGVTVANAELQQKKLAEASSTVGTSSTKAAEGVKVFNDGMDETGRALENVSIVDKFGVVLETIAPVAERTGDSLTKTSEATWSVDEASGKATETMKRLNPELFKGEESGSAAAQGFNAAGSAAASLTTRINALAEAYRKLNLVSGGEAQISGGMSGARADGGPVRRGGVYLVGEEGPEIFTPGVSGYVTSNDQSLAAMTSAANDNSVAPTSSIGNNAARSMAVSAGYMSDSADVVATAVKKWTMTDYRDSRYADSVKYQPGTAEDRWANYGGYRAVNGVTISGADYTRPDGTRPLPGDADYVVNSQSYGGIWGSPTGMRGGMVVSGTQDLNDPTRETRNTAFLLGLLGNHEQFDALNALADRQLQALKDVRDNTASFKAFQEQQKALMGTNRYDAVGDFQTLLPMLGLGGTNMGEHDPYGLMKWKEPAKSSESRAVASQDSSSGENKKEVKVQMNVFTPNAESFRQNRATIEANLAGMVQRAQRRARG